MGLTSVEAIDAEIRQLEAQKKLVEKRDTEVPKALAVLKAFAKVLTPAQRRQVSQIIGETVNAAPPKPRRASKGRKLGKVAPKYRLPTGETWSGRGLTPKVFTAWARSAEGKTWSKANGGARFPSAPGSAPAKKATTGRKKAVTKRVAKKALPGRRAKA